MRKPSGSESPSVAVKVHDHASVRDHVNERQRRRPRTPVNDHWEVNVGIGSAHVALDCQQRLAGVDRLAQVEAAREDRVHPLEAGLREGLSFDTRVHTSRQGH